MIDRYVGLPVDENLLRVLQECFADVRPLVEKSGEEKIRRWERRSPAPAAAM
jgi:hypothetical protein